MLEAADELDRMAKANHSLLDTYDKDAHKCGKCGKPCPHCEIVRLRDVLTAIIERIEKGSNCNSEVQDAKEVLAR
jgi:hypothetical protein